MHLAVIRNHFLEEKESFLSSAESRTKFGPSSFPIGKAPPKIPPIDFDDFPPIDSSKLGAAKLNAKNLI
jgi:hypothetical protein